jgi:hypothetical protein
VTERDWLEATDPTEMLAFLQGKASVRQLRLFVCAACRRVWHLLADERSRHAIEILEKVADGLASSDELNAARTGADAAVEFASWAANASRAAFSATIAVRSALVWGETPKALVNAENAIACANDPKYGPGYNAGKKAERQCQVALLRDIVGNPFRPVTLAPALVTSLAAVIAQTAYRERSESGVLDPASIAALGDALEEAGCTERTVLDHLRDRSAVHVRGCFAVDAILGRS